MADTEGVGSSSSGARDGLESVWDMGARAGLSGAALGVVGSVVLAQRRGIPVVGPWRREKGEAKARVPGGITVSGAVSMLSVSA